MLPPAHIGIGVGVVEAFSIVLPRLLGRPATSISKFVDYRLLIIGSVLPDLIDKPLELWILPGVVGDSRSIGHTAGLTGLMLFLGLLWYRRSKGSGLLSLGFGSLSHLVLDGMWQLPSTLFWPVLGLGLSEGTNHELFEYLSAMWLRPWEEPWLGAPELLGVLLAVLLVFRLWRRRQLKHFLRTGILAYGSNSDRGRHRYEDIEALPESERGL